jgi:hypothetical protein
MTTHHDDDDAWLDALAGKNNILKNPETDLVREKLIKRNRQLMNRVGISSNELDAIRRRLGQEGLLEPGPRQTWFDRLSQWLAQYHKNAWVSAAASVALIIGVMSTHLFAPDSILIKSYDSLRGKGRNATTSQQKGLFEGLEIVGRNTQIVDDLKNAGLDWESDLISSGIEYKVARKGDGGAEMEIHIMISDNINLLNEDHRRVLRSVPRKGEFVVTLKLAEKNQ